nr:hypothetical protein CFP56_74850 [Quercus suber]
MGPKRAKRGKCKVASEPEVVFDQLRFLTLENEQTFETLIKHEDMHGDPIAAVAKDGDDEVDVDTVDAAHTGPLPSSLHAMMETIMTTQATYGQLLHGLLAKVSTR